MSEPTHSKDASMSGRLIEWFENLPCAVLGHRWREEFIGGHVHAGDEWVGDRLSDGTPYMSAWHKTCRRCGRWA